MVSHPVYDRAFHLTRDQETYYAATTIISILLRSLPPVSSAIDIGCGVGTWCKVLRENGILDVRGIDGPWVDPDLLVVPREFFESFDLSSPYRTHRKFDLLLCLEVAEHLPPDNAVPFVESLTHLSDFVLFSAAVPHQMGEGHQNEQWQSDWAELFSRFGFVPMDIVRPLIWNDVKINFWYKQNTLLFVRHDRTADLTTHSIDTVLSVIHPDLFLLRCRAAQQPPSLESLNPLRWMARYISFAWQAAKKRAL